MALVCIGLLTWPDTMHWLRYNREVIQQGELWRLLTANLVHFNWRHLWLNLAAFLVLYLLYARLFSVLSVAVLLVTCMIAVTVGLYYLDPRVQWYVGLSGALHGFLACGVVFEILMGKWFGAIVGVGLVFKLAWEQLMGPMPFTAKEIDLPILVNSHLYGALCGAIMGVVYFVLNKTKKVIDC